MQDNNSENPTKDLKLYSQRSINIATFLGGIVAGGFLISQNFKALDKPKQAIISLVVGVLLTVLIVGELIIHPEGTLNRIPYQFFWVFNIGVILLAVQGLQGKVLKSHAKNKNEFYSAWRAAGIGVISLLLIVAITLGSTLTEDPPKSHLEYDSKLETFFNNEKNYLKIVDEVYHVPLSQSIGELQYVAIPKWEENIALIKSASELEGLPEDIIEQNKILLRYANLSLEAAKTLVKALKEDTDQYDEKRYQLHKEIGEELNKLEKLNNENY